MYTFCVTLFIQT